MHFCYRPNSLVKGATMKTNRKVTSITKNIDLSDEAFEYMARWVDDDYWRDTAIMQSSGNDYLLADSLVSAGAIDSKNCCEEFQQIEKWIERTAREYRRMTKKKRDDLFWGTFEGVHTFECSDCNHVSFLNDGNEEIYAEQLTECWMCDSKNVEHSVMHRKAVKR
jgi:hypothetical protein